MYVDTRITVSQVFEPDYCTCQWEQAGKEWLILSEMIRLLFSSWIEPTPQYAYEAVVNKRKLVVRIHLAHLSKMQTRWLRNLRSQCYRGTSRAESQLARCPAWSLWWGHDLGRNSDIQFHARSSTCKNTSLSLSKRDPGAYKWSSPAVIAVITHEMNRWQVQWTPTNWAPSGVENFGMIGIRKLRDLLELSLGLAAVWSDQFPILKTHQTR